MDKFLTYSEFVELNEKKFTKTVESSHLVDIDYDDDTKQLEIEFWNGNRYRYFDVPKSIFREFADEKTLFGKAGSAIKGLFKKDKTTFGTRFWSLIRRGDFKYEKIK